MRLELRMPVSLSYHDIDDNDIYNFNDNNGIIRKYFNTDIDENSYIIDNGSVYSMQILSPTFVYKLVLVLISLKQS